MVHLVGHVQAIIKDMSMSHQRYCVESGDNKNSLVQQQYFRIISFLD